MERLQKRFSSLEGAWAALRESVVNDLQSFAATRGGPSNSTDTLPSFPRGPGHNAEANQEEAERAFGALVEARDLTLEAVLDEMEECVSMGQDIVRQAWRSGQIGLVLDRGESGCQLSPVDAVSSMAAKYHVYEADSSHIKTILATVTWDGNENGEDGLDLEGLVLGTAPFLNLKVLAQVDHHIALSAHVGAGRAAHG